MDLRQLRSFVTVVEEANFTRAAARLHLAQPGVSAQIRRLERELGQQLLDRTGRTVTTTPVGDAVLPYARAALAAVEGAREAVEEFTGLLRGQVTLGLVTGAASHAFDVASALADFHDAHPLVDIALTEDTSERMLEALRRGTLDIAVTGLVDEKPPPGTRIQILVDTPLVAAMAADDPLLRGPERSGLRLAALRDRPLISLPHGTGLRGVLERACAQAGFTPHVAFEAASPPLLAKLAARGLGVAVIPAAPAEGQQQGQPGEQRETEETGQEQGQKQGEGEHITGLRTLPLTHPRLRGRVALTWREDGPTGPAAHALLARLRTAFPGPPA